MGSGSAELIADAGAAASEEEFFRCPQFLAAEGVTHTLLVEESGSRALLPLIVREIPGGGDLTDATSPYAYPGARMSGAPIDASNVDFSATGLVSLFVRDRVHGGACFAAPTSRSVVLLSDPARERKSRMSDRQQIRRNEADGYSVRELAGPNAEAADIETLHSTYTETILSVGASERYLFDRFYFEELLGSPLSRLFIADGPGGDGAAAAISVRSDGAIHNYLSGTAEAHRGASPSKNLIVAVTEYAESLGLPMNLGGGVEAGDSLEQFKRGFANCELPYRTHEVVCDQVAYDELAGAQVPAGFFPAYRAP